MVRCSKCGRDNEEGMRFCTNCGTPMTPAGPGSASGYDPSTSETISFNAPTALGMGGTPTSPYTAPPFTQSQSAPKSRTGLVLGIVVGLLFLGLLALGGVGAYVYYSNRKEVRVENVNMPQNANEPDSKPTPEASPQGSPSPASKPSFEPPTEPTKEGSFTVYANEGWQLSDIAVVPREQYTSRVEGIVDISGVKTGIDARGVKDEKFKSRRLFPEFPTGALLMRTRYADGRFSNMVATGVNGNWENLPDERGLLEFIINDKAPENNGGQFTIKVKMTRVPKQ